MEDFIDGVRLHACLWNPMHQEYRDMHVREAAWQYIVERCNNPNIPDVRTAKTEWKKLRDNHREALKRAKLGQNKLLPAQITTWKYAKVMQFLEPHMKYRITENIDMEPPQCQDSNSSKSEDVANTEIAAQRENRKRRCVDCDCTRLSSPKPKTDDALEAFFNSILRSTRDMPPWMQTRVKKKIFAVIIEEEEFLSSQDNRTENSTANCKEQSDSPIIKHVKTEIFSDDSFDAETT